MSDYGRLGDAFTAGERLSGSELRAVWTQYDMFEDDDDRLYAVDAVHGDVIELAAEPGPDNLQYPVVADRWTGTLEDDAPADALSRAVAAVDAAIDGDVSLRYLGQQEAAAGDVTHPSEKADFHALGGPGTAAGQHPNAPDRVPYDNPWP